MFNFIKDESGVTAIEYGTLVSIMLIGFIAMALIPIQNNIANSIETLTVTFKGGHWFGNGVGRG